MLGEKLFRPNDLIDVWVKLDHDITIYDGYGEPSEKTDSLHYEVDFNDYFSLMWDMKMKAFVSIGGHVINKMHIVEVTSSLSPHVAMAVSDFIHINRYSAFDQGSTREELYTKRCDGLMEQFEKNKRFLSPNNSK